ncbi:MAG: type II toxin-antitoxin system HicA family toxin [Calothrix sp. SM1_7_51]|nr:type II toxin-antitoxin system HicA family toxin [Calothrix sp. SM1_7_51]
MNSGRRKILNDLFTEPIRADVRWDDVETLMQALGAEISQGGGSRVRFAFNDVKATFHKPHPEPELKKYSVKKIKQFLENAGITLDIILRAFPD